MLEIVLAALTQSSGRVTPSPTPTSVSVPCRDKNGRFLLRCMPPGTVVKMEPGKPVSRRLQVKP